MTCNTIIEANNILLNRYLNIVNDVKKSTPNIELVKKMCIAGVEVVMLEDKQSRWLGFVQGVLFSEQLIDINVERNFSRELYHSVYKKLNIDKPDTISL